MVQYLQQSRLDEAAKLLPSTIEQAVHGTPIRMMTRVVEEKKVEAFVAFELTILASLVNVDQRLSLQGHQIPFIAQALMANFRNESLADFHVCFQRGAMGLYGDIYRLDAAVITSWMQKYLEEKYQVIENNLMKEKENPFMIESSAPKGNGKTMLDLLIEATGYVPSETQKNNSEENSYQREKIRYTPPTVDEVRKRNLHIQYIRENYDPITSKPKGGWMSESEWLKVRVKQMPNPSGFESHTSFDNSF
jgi:hypothetical protein